MSVLFDIPQVAYKTITVEYIMKDKDGNRDYIAEHEAEEDLKKRIQEYRYSPYHDHVK